MKLLYKYLSRALVLAMVIVTSLSAYAWRPEDILGRAAAKLGNAKDVTCSFTVKSGGGTVSGVLKTVGNKFAIETGSNSTWYNGNAMYTYNASSKETTVVSPTHDELIEVNPMMYLKYYNNDYKASMSHKTVAGKNIIVLTPKRKRSTVKQVVVTINAKTNTPEKFEITSSDGSITYINIGTLKLNTAIAASEFEYPKIKYKGVKIVDLR